MKPLVSVIMSAYNAQNYLKESIESILNQTYENFEFIIINDGSIDKSLEIIKYYAKKDKRIIVISRENKGLIYSLNEGIKKAKGKYIVRMDADDISLHNRLEEQVKFMEKNKDVVVCGTSAIVFDDNNESKWKVFTNEKRIKAELLFSSPFIHPTVVMRREIILKYNLFYDKNYTYAEDLELWNRISRYNLKMGNINKILFKYRNTPNSVTKSADKEFQERYKIISSIFKENLKLLGVENSEEENLLHFNLTVNHRIKNIKDKNKLLNYFNKIVEANKKTKIYDGISLKKVLGKKWLWYMYYNKYFSGVFKKYFYYGLLGIK